MHSHSHSPMSLRQRIVSARAYHNRGADGCHDLGSFLGPGRTHVLTAENVVIALKVAVGTVTLLLLASLLALVRGNYRLHGRINTVFFVLTLTALLSLEVVARLLQPDIFDGYFANPDTATTFKIHLAF